MVPSLRAVPSGVIVRCAVRCHCQVCPSASLRGAQRRGNLVLSLKQQSITKATPDCRASLAMTARAEHSVMTAGSEHTYAVFLFEGKVPYAPQGVKAVRPTTVSLRGAQRRGNLDVDVESYNWEHYCRFLKCKTMSPVYGLSCFSMSSPCEMLLKKSADQRPTSCGSRMKGRMSWRA